MHLDEFAVRVMRTLLIQRRLGRSGADDRVCGFSEDRSDAARGHNHSVGREGADLHRAQIQGADSATDALGIENGGKELPGFKLADAAFRFVSAYLLVERVQQLLTCSCPGKRGAVIKRSAKAAEIEKSFRSAIEWNSHAVE